MLGKDERKVIVDWIDIGAQYFNTPFDCENELRVMESSLSFFEFANQLHRPLLEHCAKCHSLTNIGGAENIFFQGTAFILTREVSDDFRITSSMVNTAQFP